MKRLLIDTDPGTDDAIALLMALNAPDVEVLGLTITGGNASLTHCTRNALGILEHMGRTDIPVAQGADSALNGNFRYGYDFHGHRGIGIRLPKATATPIQEDAIAFMARTLSQDSEATTLVALGPLTNIARFLEQHPDAARRISELIVMGGATEKGNVTPYAEFNTYNDPQAAAIVFSAGLPITLAPLEACAQVVMNVRDLRRYRGEKTPAARLAHRILRKWFERRGFDQEYDPCDPLALALAIAPDIAAYQKGAITVDASDAETKGRTVFQPGQGVISLASQIDTDRFHALMDKLLKVDQ